MRISLNYRSNSFLLFFITSYAVLNAQPIARVQFVHTYPAYPAVSATFTSNNTAGNAIVVMASWYLGPGTPTISDTRGNAYTMLPALTGGGAGNGEQTSILIWYALNIAAGANTVTISGAGIDVGVTAVEYSGIATSGAIGVTSTLPYFGGAQTTTPTSNSFTPSAGSLLFVAFADETNPQNSIAAGSRYTLIQGDGNHVDIEEDNVNSSAGPQTASITVNIATWSWAMYVVEFLPAGANSPPPLGTVLWTNTGDGSGFSSIVPAVPSATGVADVFGFQNDGTVAAIAADGTTAWTASAGDAYRALPDFQGGLVLLGSSLSRLDGMTGEVSSTYALPSNMGVYNTAVHTDGTIFLSGFSTTNDQTAGETYVMGVDPLTGSQKFNIGMGDATPGNPGVGIGWRSDSGGSGVLIIAGDGNAYAAAEWAEIVARDPDTNRAIYQFHIDALKVSSSGASQLIRVWDYPADFTPQSFNPHIITDADQGVAINWRDGLNDQIYLALVSGGGVVVSIAPGRQNFTSDMQSVLQLQDGTFVGAIVEMGIAGERPVKHALRAKLVQPPPTDYPNTTIVAYDRSGNYRWLVSGDYPMIATADGGVIGQSGTTYDQNGNATGQVPLYTQSWTYATYQAEGTAINQLFSIPAILATSYTAFQPAESTASLPLPDRVKVSTDDVGTDPLGSGGALIRNISYTLLQGAHVYPPAKNAVIQEKLIYISGQQPQAASGNAGQPYEDQVGTRGRGQFDLRQQMLAIVPGDRPFRIQIVPCLANNQSGAAIWENRNIVTDQQVLINNDPGSTQGRTCQVP